jgi:hypothetical protein
VLRLDLDAARTINSLDGGSDGRVLILHNISAFTLSLLHDDGATGTAAMRFSLPNSASLQMSPGASAVLRYDATTARWRLAANAWGRANQTDMEAGASASVLCTPFNLHNHPAVPKCWVEGQANSTTILASYNITSLADTATGAQTVTIGTDFSSANWCCMVTRSEDDLTLVYSATYDAKAAGSVIMRSAVEGGSGSDPTSASGNASWSMVGLGDQ